MNNMISILTKDLEKYRRSIKLPGESEVRPYFLLMMIVKSNKLNDLKTTYGDKVTDVHEKVFRKAFGDTERENSYGVVIDDDLKIVFAYNCAFADYNKDAQEIVFQDIEEMMLEMIRVLDEEDAAEKKRKIPPSIPPFDEATWRDPSQIRLMYGIPHHK